MISTESRNDLVANRDNHNLSLAWQTLTMVRVVLLGLFLFLNPASAYTATLLTGSAPAPASVDLTAVGSSDWIHWGLTSATSIERKSGVTPRIGSFTVVGGSVMRYRPPAGVRVDYTWSDGTPTASATTTGVYLRGVGNRFELTVSRPAQTRRP